MILNAASATALSYGYETAYGGRRRDSNGTQPKLL